MSNDMNKLKNAKIAGQDLCAPYTFVPINTSILTSEAPSHTKPEPHGISGKIRVRLTNETPLLVGGADGKNNEPFCVDNRYMVPGSSLRGMLRSVVEIAAFGRVNFVGTHPAAVRNQDSARWREFTKASAQQPRQAGWLFKTISRDGALRRNSYHIVRASQTHRFPLVDLCALLECTVNDWHRMSAHTRLALIKNKRLDGILAAELFKLHALDAGKAQLIISGATPEELIKKSTVKKCEYLAVWPERPRPQAIEQKLAENFLGALARDANTRREDPQHNISALERTGSLSAFGKQSLERQLADPAAHGIPIFIAGDGKNMMLSMTAYYRVSYRNNMHDVLARTQPPKRQNADQLDMAEALFGWAPPEVHQANAHLRGAREKSWRGRVRVGFAEQTEGDSTCVKVTLPGISPRPSFHPFYLRPEGDDAKHPIDLDNPAAILSGRKRYPVRSTPTPPPQIDGSSQTNELSFLKPHKSFTFELRLHNTRPQEAGALIWALTLGQLPDQAPADNSALAAGPDVGLRHMLGRGRNYGYGQIQLQIDRAALRYDQNGTAPDLNDLVTQFKDWVAAGLSEAGESVTDFDERDEIQRLLGSCHAKTGDSLRDCLRYTGQNGQSKNSQSILDAHVAIKAKSQNVKNKGGLEGAPAPQDPQAPGYIGLPPWPRFDWKSRNQVRKNA